MAGGAANPALGSNPSSAINLFCNLGQGTPSPEPQPDRDTYTWQDSHKPDQAGFMQWDPLRDPHPRAHAFMSSFHRS